MTAPEMITVQDSGQWWILGCPDVDQCGPYQTRAEAEDDRRGIARFYRTMDDPTAWPEPDPQNQTRQRERKAGWC